MVKIQFCRIQACKHMVQKDLNIRQLFDVESSTYTYLVMEARSQKAVLIDPVLSQKDRDLRLIKELDVQLILVMDTHIHADHFSAAGCIRDQLKIKSACAKMAKLECADLALADGEVIPLGDAVIECLATPGHTRGCMSYKVGHAVMTGDALLIRGTGRTDFQGGSAQTLYKSIHEKLFTLPPETLVYPGHDYKGFSMSTIREERQHNPRVKDGISCAEFAKIMSELNLPHPKLMDQVLPANSHCGQSPAGL